LKIVEPVEIKPLSEILSYETPAPRGQVKLVPADDVAKLVELLHTEARVI
jgi:electron transfer flavoprotein beta subunit